MLSASFIAKKPLKFVTAAAAVLLSAGTENLASHSESIKAHTGQVHALKLNLNLQSKIKAANAEAVDAKVEGTANEEDLDDIDNSSFVSDVANDLNGNGDFYDESFIDLNKTEFLFSIAPDPRDYFDIFLINNTVQNV